MGFIPNLQWYCGWRICGLIVPLISIHTYELLLRLSSHRRCWSLDDEHHGSPTQERKRERERISLIFERVCVFHPWVNRWTDSLFKLTTNDYSMGPLSPSGPLSPLKGRTIFEQRENNRHNINCVFNKLNNWIISLICQTP